MPVQRIDEPLLPDIEAWGALLENDDLPVVVTQHGQAAVIVVHLLFMRRAYRQRVQRRTRQMVLAGVGNVGLIGSRRQAWRVLVLLLAYLLFGLLPLAYADPPDPLWLAGFWDDDDFDNVVIAVCAATALVVEPSRSATVPGASPLEVPPHAFGLSPAPASALSIRAPPIV